MNSIRYIIGTVSIAVGLYLVVSADKSMETTGQKIKKEFTGTYSEYVKYTMIGGIILIVAGGGILISSRWKSS